MLRSKICLVGCSCAGKTSFVKSIILRHPQLVHLVDHTIGIDHFPLRLRRHIPRGFWRRLVGREKIKAHEVMFWDFAGQDAYQVAHSAFFTPRTMFFVFIDRHAFFIAYMQAAIFADQEFQEPMLLDEFFDRAVLHWVRMILSRQPDAELVFIATKEDLAFENTYIETLLKKELRMKLRGVDRIMKEMKRQVNQVPMTTSAESYSDFVKNDHTILYVSSASTTSVIAARERVEELILKSERSIQMPDNYVYLLDAVVKIREEAKTHNNIKTRVERVFAAVDMLPKYLKIEPNVCRLILQTLHDLGDVLWYETLEVGVFRKMVILEPMLLIEFIRQVITHNHTGLIMAHHDLSMKEYWNGLDPPFIGAMKKLLQEFHLVYSGIDHRKMEWDSDLIVPAYWHTKKQLLGQDLCVKIPDVEIKVHVCWEYLFPCGLPSPLFDHIVVASVSSMIEFDAGPDWILYDGNEGTTACRVLVHRDRRSLHRTIQVEAVIADTATPTQAKKLWDNFQHLIGSFYRVLRENQGWAMSCTAREDGSRKHNLKRLLASKNPQSSRAWMPPPEMWNSLQL